MGIDSKPELKYRADVSLLLVLRSLCFFFSSLVFFIALPRLDGILLEAGVGILSYSSFDSSGTYSFGSNSKGKLLVISSLGVGLGVVFPFLRKPDIGLSVECLLSANRLILPRS